MAARVRVHERQRPGDVVEAEEAGRARARRRRRGGGGTHASGAGRRRTGRWRRSARPRRRGAAALTRRRPPAVSAVPCRPSRVCITQSNWSTPAAIGEDQRRRVAHTHEVPRAVRRAGARRRRRARAASPRASRRPRARRCRSRRSRARRSAARSRPPGGVDTALDDAEQRLALPAVGRPGAGRPGGRPLGGHADRRRRARQRRAHVEHHLDVGAEELLDGHRRFRRQAVAGAVVDGPERDPVVVDLGLQAEDLEAPRVGQRQPVPAGEAAEAAEAGDRLGAGPEHQVVRVAQHDLGAQHLVVGRAQVLRPRRGSPPA